jgi:hypothetical protein
MYDEGFPDHSRLDGGGQLDFPRLYPEPPPADDGVCDAPHWLETILVFVGVLIVGLAVVATLAD